MPLGVVTCVLLARAATAALAAVLSSRRFRDLALVGLVLFGLVFALGGNLLGSLADSDPARLRAALGALARALGWSPFGWAWAVPADVARGDWLVAGIHLVLAAGLVVRCCGGPGRTSWTARLTSPVERPGDSRQVAEFGWVDRLFPATPAGGVAARTLRYWRRDPRYLAGIAGFLIAPVILIVAAAGQSDGEPLVAAFAPTLVGLLVGLSVAQDLAYDGSALWLHARLGLRGADDRAGRAWCRPGGLRADDAGAATGRPGRHREWAPGRPAAALSLGSGPGGLGVGSVVGALWQWPAPPPGANPFQRQPAAGCRRCSAFDGHDVRDPDGRACRRWPWSSGRSSPRGSVTWPWSVGLASGLVVFRIGDQPGRPAARAPLARGAAGGLGEAWAQPGSG